MKNRVSRKLCVNGLWSEENGGENLVNGLRDVEIGHCRLSMALGTEYGVRLTETKRENLVNSW